MHKQFAIASLSLVILLTSTNLVAGQIVVDGQCPNVTTVQNFNLSAYVGDWYVYEKYPAEFVVGGNRCLKATYTPTGPQQISVLITQFNSQNQLLSTPGAAAISGPGELLFIINGPAGSIYEYLILDTDYVSYAVVFSCNQGQNNHSRFAWLLTRESNPSNAVVSQGEAVFQAQGIPTAPLVVENQQNC